MEPWRPNSSTHDSDAEESQTFDICFFVFVFDLFYILFFAFSTDILVLLMQFIIY